ncbi:MAG: hypothetical protein O3B01_16785 [Planctomycetota bacterium]|nr:hypothetical protein [Planctomycetota bacterium]MDA1140233.1 hypothetical protein [Planctomycetota bacterium]
MENRKLDSNEIDPLRVLFIGNSQFAVWDIPRMVQELSASGRQLLCEGCLIGGSWLQTHLENSNTLNKLENGPWDMVVLQEHYRAPEGDGRAKFFAAASDFCGRISALSATPILYASPNIESEGIKGFAAIHSMNLELARKLNLVLAGAGAACLKVWKKRPDLDFHDKDRAHPNYKASYVGACVLYAALTGHSPIGLTSRCGKSMVSEDEAHLFQMAAWEEYQETNSIVQRRTPASDTD